MLLDARARDGRHVRVGCGIAVRDGARDAVENAARIGRFYCPVIWLRRRCPYTARGKLGRSAEESSRDEPPPMPTRDEPRSRTTTWPSIFSQTRRS